MAKVAVITRTQNRPLMLPRARESVEKQTFSDFIWVVVNDAGEKDYVEQNAEAARAKGVSVEVIHREESFGMEVASNNGVRGVDSEFVVIHDDDDSWEPGFLEKTVSFLEENQQCLGVVCVSQAIYERVEKDRVVELKREPYNAGLDSIQLADMVQVNRFAPISFLYRRSAYNAVGGYNESLPPLSDWDFALNMLLKGDLGFIPDMLANYHIRETVAEDQTEYGNSITSGVNIHAIRDAEYRNLKIREDLDEGRIGLGFLLCQGRQTYQVLSSIHFMARAFEVPRKIWRNAKQKLSFR